MTELIIDIDLDIEEFIKDVMQNYPEYSDGNCLKCIRHDYNRCSYIFFDDETEFRHVVNMPMLKKGLGILIGLTLAAYNFGLHFPLDAGDWDATDVDALVQCAIFGKIIYG